MGTVKSTWWSITAFNDEIKIMETPPYPAFVRKVLGGREICPDTGREHFQGAVQMWSQVRMSQIKSWLPTAHLEPAKQVEALQKYAMKQETASGEKKSVENTLPHFTANQICEKIALAILSGKGQTDRQTDSFWRGVKIILAESPELAGQLMNPSLRNFYKNTESVWINRAIVLQHDSVPTPPCDCDKDECEACYYKNLSPEYNATSDPQISQEGSPTPSDSAQSATCA